MKHFCPKTNKRGVLKKAGGPNKSGGGWKNFQKLISGGRQLGT